MTAVKFKKIIILPLLTFNKCQTNNFKMKNKHYRNTAYHIKHIIHQWYGRFFFLAGPTEQ